MPIVVVRMLEGRTVDQKRLLAAEFTESIKKILGSKGPNISIVFEDLPLTNMSRDGVLYCDKEDK